MENKATSNNLNTINTKIVEKLDVLEKQRESCPTHLNNLKEIQDSIKKLNSELSGLRTENQRLLQGREDWFNEIKSEIQKMKESQIITPPPEERPLHSNPPPLHSIPPTIHSNPPPPPRVIRGRESLGRVTYINKRTPTPPIVYRTETRVVTNTYNPKTAEPEYHRIVISPLKSRASSKKRISVMRPSQRESITRSRPGANVFIEKMTSSPRRVSVKTRDPCVCKKCGVHGEYEEVERKHCPMCNSLLIQRSPIRKSVESRLRNLDTFGDNTGQSVSLDTILRASSRHQIIESKMVSTPMKYFLFYAFL